MEKISQDGIELEIREHTDGDFLPEKYPICEGEEIRRHTYKIRTIQDLGTPLICRRIRYERVYFKCKTCDSVFSIEHPLIPIGARYMPGVIKYAVSRVLERGDFTSSIKKFNFLFLNKYKK